MNFPPYPPLTSLVFASSAGDLGHEWPELSSRSKGQSLGGSFSRDVPGNNQTAQLLRGWLVVMTNHPRTKCWSCVWNVDLWNETALFSNHVFPLPLGFTRNSFGLEPLKN